METWIYWNKVENIFLKTHMLKTYPKKKKKGNPYGTFQDENNSILKLKKKKVGGFKNSLDLGEEKK